MHSAAETRPSSVIRILTIPRVRAAACLLEFDENRPHKFPGFNGDGEPGITYLGITESGITESGITWVMGIRHNRNWYNGISYNIEVECGITESGITESGITRKFDSGIRHNNKWESGITESSITESGIT